MFILHCSFATPRSSHGRTTNLEGLSEDQPGQHPDQGVSGHRCRRDVSFNQLHAECQTRIQQKRWCPNCEREVPNTDIVKGYEFEKGRYVVMDEEDIEKVRVDSTRVINLEKFTDDTAIDPIYLERPVLPRAGRRGGAGGVRGHS